jgi:hypothetical protein
MRRIALGVVLSFGLLVGSIASPAAADNPPGYPDLVGFAWGTAVPPAATIPTNALEPDVPELFRSLFFADPEVFSGIIGPIPVGDPWMAVEVMVARPIDGDPDHLGGFVFDVIGLQSVSGDTITLVGWGRFRSVEMTDTGTVFGPFTPYQPSAVTMIDG